MRDSAVYAVVRCLSVRLSVTLVYCVETTELIIKQFALDCSLRTLVMRTSNVEQVSLGAF